MMINRQQLCAELNVSESTVRRLEHVGLPFVPVGPRSHRYDLEECKAWLRDNPACLKRPAPAPRTPSWSNDPEFVKSCERARRRMTPS